LQLEGKELLSLPHVGNTKKKKQQRAKEHGWSLTSHLKQPWMSENIDKCKNKCPDPASVLRDNLVLVYIL
jgi:hypothetical protein